MLIVRGLIGGLFQVALLAAVLLIPAGTWRWPRALQFLVTYGVIVEVAIIVLARYAPASLEARLAGPTAESQPVADRVATGLIVVSLVAWFAFIPIDVFRWRLLPAPSVGISALGAIIAVIGFGIIFAALVQNAFAAPIVKDQSDRGQVLIDTGLYAHIRHPFYLGLLLWLAGVALWLESYSAIVALTVVLGALVARVKVEERVLRATLSGYADYIERVRYRIVPYVW